LKNRITLLGHRGYRHKYPENTLLAFRKAFEYKAAGIELDVQKTGDGHYVVIHDETVDRVTNGSGRVGEMDLKSLQKLDAGSGEKIPLFTELLDIIPSGGIVNVELKNETLTLEDGKPLMDILKKYEGKIDFLVSSFEHPLLKPFKEEGFIVGMLIGEEHEHLGLTGLVREVIRYKPHYLNLPVDLFKHLPPFVVNLLVKTARLFGRRIAYWTVNTPEEVELVKKTAHVIITDDVEGVLHLLGEE
jgi:glycerophosphoryl diester phosphodiesterase